MKFHVNDLKPPNAMNAIKMSNTFGSCNEENCLVAFTWWLTKWIEQPYCIIRAQPIYIVLLEHYTKPSPEEPIYIEDWGRCFVYWTNLLQYILATASSSIFWATKDDEENMLLNPDFT